MNANYSIQLTEGDYTATYTIYYNSVSASNIATLLISNLPADGLSLTTMLAGVNISVPGTANLIIVVGDGYCANSIEFQIVPIQTPVPPPDLCLSFIGDGILYSWQFTPNSTQNNKTKWESIQNGTTYTMYWNPFVVPNVWQVEIEPTLVFTSTNTTDIPDSSWTVQGSGSYGPITNLNVIQGTCPDIEPITTKTMAENNLCADGTSCTGIITVLTTLGGTPPYQYSLDNSTPTSSTIFSNVCPGQHDLETIDSNGLTNTTQVTIQQGQIPETYFLDIVYSNVNVSSSVDTDIKKVEWAITTRPALPVGASVAFELILDSTQITSSPGTGVITIDEKTYLNNVLQIPLTNQNTSTSNRTDGCSAFQKSTTVQGRSYFITLTSSSVLTGTTVSTLNIPTNSGSLSSGCVTKLEQSLKITINNFKFLGTCSNTNTPKSNTILQNQLLYVANSFSWRKDTFDCEGGTQFNITYQLSGLSSPSNLWYDSSTNRVWVVDLDNYIKGNIYWFDPQTPNLSETNMNYYAGIKANSLYNNYIDTVYKRIYLTGTDTTFFNVDGLFVFDIQTQTNYQIAYGSSAAFQRQLLFVTSNYIYCKKDDNNLIRFERSNPQLSTSVDIPINLTQQQQNYLASGAQRMLEVGSGTNARIWVVGGSGGNRQVKDIGIFDTSFTYITSIVLPGAAYVNLNNSQLGPSCWQSSFYDSDSANRYFYVCDFGGRIKFRISVNSTNDGISNGTLGGTATGVSFKNVLENKSFGTIAWTLDPVTGNLYEAYGLFNTLSDTQIYKMYQISRTTGATLKLIDNKYITNVVQVNDGLSDSLMGSNTGLFYWSNAGGTTWNTDGTITFFNNTVGGGNTGKVIVRTLRKWNDTTNQQTTQTKRNVVGDPDYIPPYIDNSACPPEINDICPSGFTKTVIGTAPPVFYYEFDVPNGVQNNTANIDRIKVSIRSDIGNTVLNSTTYNRPFNDYNIGSFTVNNISCNLILEYINIVNGVDTVIKTCTPN